MLITACRANQQQQTSSRHVLVVAGRLMHHLKEVEGMSLRTVEYCVFDEADRLFEMGFAAQLREILAKMNESRQVLHSLSTFAVWLTRLPSYAEEQDIAIAYVCVRINSCSCEHLVLVALLEGLCFSSC